MQVKIIPSIIAKSQNELEKRINKVKNHVQGLQLDVMDGKFMRNSSLNFEFKLPKTKCKYEAHLMIKKPKEWIETNSKKVNTIIFHIETCKDNKEIRNLIKLIKSKKRKVGIALNPRTKIERIKPFLNNLDMVLIMTVNPGFYGSKFLPSTLNKVKQLRKLKSKLNIEVDGGITPKTISQASEAGANQFISGSYIQKSKNVKKAIENLKN